MAGGLCDRVPNPDFMEKEMTEAITQYHTAPLSREEKIEQYMRLDQRVLAEMLVNANMALASMPHAFFPGSTTAAKREFVQGRPKGGV